MQSKGEEMAKATDIFGDTGEVIERELTGLESRVFLHEYDHLLGITFDQRVGNLSFKMAKDKRKKEEKRAERKTSKQFPST